MFVMAVQVRVRVFGCDYVDRFSYFRHGGEFDNASTALDGCILPDNQPLHKKI